jgi:hypothetical protein
MEMPTNKQTKEQKKRAKDVRACKQRNDSYFPQTKTLKKKQEPEGNLTKTNTERNREKESACIGKL